MAKDHHAESGGFRLQIETCQIMQHIDRDAAHLDDFDVCEFARPRGLVNVAANGRHRRDRAQSIENLGRAYVARVNDVLRPAQGFQCFGTKQAVGIGNDANDDEILRRRVSKRRIAE